MLIAPRQAGASEAAREFWAIAVWCINLFRSQCFILAGCIILYFGFLWKQLRFCLMFLPLWVEFWSVPVGWGSLDSAPPPLFFKVRCFFIICRGGESASDIPVTGDIHVNLCGLLLSRSWLLALPGETSGFLPLRRGNKALGCGVLFCTGLSYISIFRAKQIYSLHKLIIIIFYKKPVYDRQV